MESIDDFSVERFGQDVADTYSRGFSHAFALLREHPLAGPAKPELGTGIRCLMHRKHRIFYRVDKEIVLIIRIVHHARDATEALKG